MLCTVPALADGGYYSQVVAPGKGALLGFGDSITYGLGDLVAPGAAVTILPETNGRSGYLTRVSALLGIPTENKGVRGEELVADGVSRLPGVVLASQAPVVSLLEGANDAFSFVTQTQFRLALQKELNITFVLGKLPLLATIPRPCCNHAGIAPFVEAYNQAARETAVVYGLPVADLELAWQTTCANAEACELFNLPEGLHPNTRGYDVIAQTVTATLLGIDIFSPKGAADMEKTLGLAPGSIIIRPRV